MWPSFSNSIDLSMARMLADNGAEKVNLNLRVVVVFYLCDISVCLWVIQMNVYRQECNSFKIMSFYFNSVLHNFKSFRNATDISHALQCDAFISASGNKRFLCFVLLPLCSLLCFNFYIFFFSNTASAWVNRHTHYTLTVRRRAMNKRYEWWLNFYNLTIYDRCI